jgi:hypothetical protein
MGEIIIGDACKDEIIDIAVDRWGDCPDWEDDPKVKKLRKCMEKMEPGEDPPW